MKISLPFLMIIFSMNFAFAQTKEYKATIDKFQRNFNANEYGEIFNLFSQEMKKALPFEKTKEFLSAVKSQNGEIENMEFINFHQGSYGLYKTKFVKAVMAVNISLNEQHQINGFFIKPYQQLVVNEKKTINSLSNYPKAIADLIFSKVKDLPNNAQLSIATIEGGKTYYYGVIKTNDTVRPVENQRKIFEIGSITKVFTATVLASLVQRKRINLTEPINSYYPFAFKDNVKLTFESLANHTAGLPRLPENLVLLSDNPYQRYGKSEIEAYLKDFMKLENKPSVVYSYSNIGAGLLGYTLGLSQRTSFQNLLQKIVFDKYKMKDSFDSSDNLGDGLVKGLNKMGETVPSWDFDALFGAGGILSTTEDLTKFAIAQFNPNNKELELTRRTTFEIKGDTKIGLGWHKLESKNGENLYWHNGGTGGYSSSMVMKVKEKMAVVILSNVFDINDKIDALSYDLINQSGANTSINNQ